MMGTYNSIKGVLSDFPTLILPEIFGEPTREYHTKIYRLISGNAESMVSNLGGGRNVHLALTITTYDYLAQTGHAFVSLYKPIDPPLTMRTAQEQALGTDNFRRNQALLKHCTAVDSAIKNKIVMMVQQVLLSPIVDQLTEFRQVTSLEMLQYLLRLYGAIGEINLKENAVKMMGNYDPTTTLARIIIQHEKGQKFEISGRQTISESIMVSRGIAHQ